ncbi:hypothetical protein, partial [Allocoleopsis sp.]|uniref:hypothetical protein n=1 Tax=Allocoleopsis sp. TaxID=3088169 RepID=UPI002FD078CD
YPTGTTPTDQIEHIYSPIPPWLTPKSDLAPHPTQFQGLQRFLAAIEVTSAIPTSHQTPLT